MKGWKKVLLILMIGAVAGIVPRAKADELSDLSQMLNYVESHFWRGITGAPESAPRKVLQRYAEQLQYLATKVQRQRYYKNSRIGNPTEPATRLRNLISSFSQLPLRRTYTGQLRTRGDDFNKFLKRQQRSSKQTKFSLEEQIGFYEEFIVETKAKNLEKFETRYRNSNELARSQYQRLAKIAEEYFDNVSKLRMIIFQLRRQDPGFSGKR